MFNRSIPVFYESFISSVLHSVHLQIFVESYFQFCSVDINTSGKGKATASTSRLYGVTLLIATNLLTPTYILNQHEEPK
jgi:hypothetical protein